MTTSTPTVSPADSPQRRAGILKRYGKRADDRAMGDVHTAHPLALPDLPATTSGTRVGRGERLVTAVGLLQTLFG